MLLVNLDQGVRKLVEKIQSQIEDTNKCRLNFGEVENFNEVKCKKTRNLSTIIGRVK